MSEVPNGLAPPGIKSNRESPLGSSANITQPSQPSEPSEPSQPQYHPQQQNRHDNRHQPNTSISGSLNTKITDVDTDAIRQALENVQINTYNHIPNRIPPYVMDTIARSHHRDLENTTAHNTSGGNSNPGSTNVSPTNIIHQRQPSLRRIQSERTLSTLYDEEQYLSFANDPYVRAMDGNWFKFIRSIRQQNAYTSDKIRYDDSFLKEYDLESPWGGAKRLKSAYVGDFMEKGEDTSEISKHWFSRLFRTRKQPDDDENNPRVRSTAGYWMGENRNQLFPIIRKFFLFNPLVPLLLRILTLMFLAISLGIAASIFKFAASEYQGVQFGQQASTVMAVVVETVGIVYVIGIAYDEYHGKPLGLRDPISKMRLIMLDLLFIIFSSANLSLTFNTLYDDEWVCVLSRTKVLPIENNGGLLTLTVDSVCRRQRALASFLMVVLVLWVITFTVSLLRVVDRVASPGRV
ncbi:uncharacterized protein SPAPADRAFT_61839, partial [Spathaspora passalidarum NRRL Y-27907]